jgi:hypothetical protein
MNAQTVRLMSDADGMVYTRGSRDDWDMYAQITGEQNLSWDKMQPLFFKVKSIRVFGGEL